MSVDLEHRPSDEALVEQYSQYRAISATAVISCVLGVLSAAIFLGWVFAVIPLLGLIMGTLAILRIRRNPAELSGRGVAQAGIALSLLFFCGGASYLTYDYVTEVPEGYERLSYAQLQPDPEQPGQLLPPDVAEFDGKRIFIKGYAYPGKEQSGIKEFVLCRDNGDCCFGGQPKLTDRILIDLKGHLSYKYSTRMVRLAGTFHVKRGEAVDGLSGVVYHLEADYLK